VNIFYSVVGSLQSSEGCYVDEVSVDRRHLVSSSNELQPQSAYVVRQTVHLYIIVILLIYYNYSTHIIVIVLIYNSYNTHNSYTTHI